MKFPEAAVVDPGPRAAHSGLTLGASLRSAARIPLFRTRFSGETEDIFVENDDPISYQNGPGDIEFQQHILKGTADQNVTIHRGMEVNFLNVLTFMRGNYINESLDIRVRTEDIGFESSGLIYPFNRLLPNNELLLTNHQHINLEYNESTHFERSGHPLNNGHFKSGTLSLISIDQFVAWVFS